MELVDLIPKIQEMGFKIEMKKDYLQIQTSSFFSFGTTSIRIYCKGQEYVVEPRYGLLGHVSHGRYLISSIVALLAAINFIINAGPGARYLLILMTLIFVFSELDQFKTTNRLKDQINSIVNDAACK